MLHPDDLTKPASRSSHYKAAAVHPIDEEEVSEVCARGCAGACAQPECAGISVCWMTNSNVSCGHWQQCQ
jgi:hypothetical protein